MTRAQPLAVHDANAAHALLECADEELAQGGLCLGDRHAMEIDLALHAVIAAPQAAQQRGRDLRAMKRHRFAGELLEVCRVRVEAFTQHRGPIGTCETRARADLRLPLQRGVRAQTPDTAHRLPEEPRVLSLLIGLVIVRQGRHATLRRPWSASSIVSQLRAAHPIPRQVKILVSNDDGYRAEGIRRLRDALSTLAEVTVVAPDRNRSGASNSLTLDVPLRVFESEPGVYFVPGTPTDCVHLAISGLFDFEHDMVVSGVNDGPNLGDDVLYSGTVAAAVEGRFLGLPTIAMSLCTGGGGGGHFGTGAEVARVLVAELLQRPLESSLILNVNVPDVPFAELRGFRASRLGYRHRSAPVMRAQDPRGRPVYWVGPAGPQQDAGPGTDFDTVARGFVSVTPLQVDLTRHAVLPALGTWLDGLNG